MTNTTHEWWGHLRHGGVLIAPQLLDEFFPELPSVRERDYYRLRDGWLTFQAAPDDAAARREFAEAVLRGFCGLIGWQKGNQVHDRFKATSPTGMKLRPDWVLTDASGERGLLAISFDDASRLGIGRSKRAYARLVDLLRATGMPFGVLTNGRQFRLVHAGPDFAAWTEWDASAWFDESEGRDQLRGLRALVGHDSLVEPDEGRDLRAAVQASRHRQGDLAQVLGEQVRQAVEHVIDALDAGLQTDADLLRQVHKDPDTGQDVGDDAVLAAIYQAATRVVMRLVVLLYAEARELLPRSNELYHGSYGVDGLYQQLTAATQHAGGLGALGERQTAWPRLLALFNVVHQGSPHQDLPIRDYGGTLFRSGDLDDRDTVLRALAVLEQNGPDDATVLRILRLLKIGKVKVRKGRSATWVSGPVDFSDLRTEYIGIIYEGLLDFQLKRAPDEDAIVFLNVGRQPALPLSRLEAMSNKQVKDLISELKKDKPATSTEGGEDDEANDEVAESSSDDDEEAIEAEGTEDDEAVSDEALRQRARDWAEQAVEAAGTVRRTKKQSASEHARHRSAAARKLIDRVIGPQRLYLATWGGLRKGTGTFYTRPALAVPTTQRTLEPLCYDRTAEGLRPKAPEEILELKVCDPAMGSGSFPVAALRYLTDALTDSLIAHDRIRAQADGAAVTLPFGHEASGDALEELLPVPLDDDRFETLLRSRLARHVVERCIYGVDINPMAVELARLALWVETMDRELPFEFLDHKLKVGNSLVGAWIHLALDYPAAAWDREAGDGDKGEETKWLKATYRDRVKPELKELLKRRQGEHQLPGLDVVQGDPLDTVVDLGEQLSAIHHLATREEREDGYWQFLQSQEYSQTKALLDRWSAVWFWPTDPSLREPALTPREWAHPSSAVQDRVQALASEYRFFHWEVEFADVFRTGRSGFDAILGNPPWETVQTESREFFSNYDPLYRTRGKQEAIRRQQELFESDTRIQTSWIAYKSGFKANTNWVKSSAAPFDANLGSAQAVQQLTDQWATDRASRSALAGRDQPFRLQGGGKVYTYRLFSELASFLVNERGRVGLLLPSGIWTDYGAQELRKEWLFESDWEWCFAFENKEKVFPIHSMFKFGIVVVDHGARTRSIHTAFMRQDVGEWEQPSPPSADVSLDEVRRFSPEIFSLLEFRGDLDLDLTDRIYADHPLLDRVVDRLGGQYSREFNTTSDSKKFTSRRQVDRLGILEPTEDLRDPRVRARLRLAGYELLYEGKSIWLHDPYFLGKRARASISKVVPDRIAQESLSGSPYEGARIAFRHIASSTNQRTLCVAVIPPAVHADSASTLVGPILPLCLAATMGSLVLDYVTRMKVTTNMNWFHIGTLPVPESLTGEHDLLDLMVRRLNMLGAEFANDVDPLVDPRDRMATRLVMDALVAAAYEIDSTDLAHISTRFPIYDKGAGDFTYPKLAVKVYEAFLDGGLSVAQARADALTQDRAAAGYDFGLDRVYVPEGGWAQANAEARAILEAG